jgi:hypothetical protein
MFACGTLLFTMLQGVRPWSELKGGSYSYLFYPAYRRCTMEGAEGVASVAREQCRINAANANPACVLDPRCMFCSSPEADGSGRSCRISREAAEVIAALLHHAPEHRASIETVKRMSWVANGPLSMTLAAASASAEQSSHPSSSSSSSSSSLPPVGSSPASSSVVASNPVNLSNASQPFQQEIRTES